EGGTAVDAVEAAVRVLEDNVFFNAGYGSVLNRNGEVECGAMIMEGHTLNNGAVISGRHFKNPVSLSKEIMYESSCCALSGDGALEFAREKNFPICKPEELIHTPGPTPADGPDTSRTDTVAAVAIDANGHLACATST
ncbi:isoaspartyl peptidase L-asparaginase, partial [Paramuricea clavata]